MPLEHLLSVMRDPNESDDRRMGAAIAAAPCCHRKLMALEHTGQQAGPIERKVVLTFD
jgi:hypothetical protein